MITWPQLPDERHLWDGKPSHYIKHCIGYNGKYSLNSELVKQGLVVSCFTISGTKLNGAVSNFTIAMDLTNKGVRKYEEVVRITFAFINKMRQSGVKDYILHELAVNNKIRF